ncbi:XRE family transcriptional regulator [Mammaliicoccus sciuri]|uniref:XRE family transcriptional regulator n=1 Tax=Mammaliicoccus sciuri TaxID=1296 RepID=A0AAJ4SF51_MAMSC|nr:XRE family transcriptional regulator [Mammaliicoccus sciuri]
MSLGLSQSTISNWLQQISYPKYENLQQLAVLIDVPRSYLTEKLIEE